ncbi:hypothetical protein GCM10027610_129500 [Dactylosporangium cerinum]
MRNPAELPLFERILVLFRATLDEARAVRVVRAGIEQAGASHLQATAFALRAAQCVGRRRASVRGGGIRS